MTRSQPPGSRAEGPTPRGAPRRLHERGRRILIVDDAEGIRTYLANLLELRGYQVDTAEDGRRALALLESGAAPEAILLDVMMPGLDGLETLRRIREAHPSVNVVMLSVVGRAQTIVEAMQLGAVDYLNKPFEEEELDIVLRSALEKRALERERERLLGEVGYDPDSAVWLSPPMRSIREVLEQISDTDVTVLIQGESGSGKEIVARAAHRLSTRREGPFVKVNCAALPPDLLESELFGYERGAFTGAVSRKPGKFEAADRGTIFLDEIGEMSPALQESRFTRLGGNEDVQVEMRVVCATNRDLELMVRAGTFREDLFFRLNVVTVRIPPLRERREELAALVDAFLTRYSVRYGKSRPRLSQRLQRALERYAFPGNVRELENMMKRIVVLGSESSVLQDLLGSERRGAGDTSSLEALLSELEATAGDLPLREVGARAALEAERHAIENVLFHTNWNRKQAARLLSVSYKTLLQKIRECGLEPE